MKRVSFSSPDQLPESLFEPAAWMRLWFPVGFCREVQRGYTVAGYAPDRSRVDVSFYLHQTSGPAASWALHVHAGSMLNASLAGSRPFTVDEHCSGVLLVGDETAYPAIRAIVDSLPERVRAYVLLTGRHDLTRFIECNERVKAWYVPTQKTLHAFMKLKDKLQIDSAEPGVWRCWAAGESSMMRAIRASIRHVGSLPKDDAYVQGYWVRRRLLGL
ncbi:siderophore-interacting protein [Bifidobacterium sp.]|jgi:NADPH-dependent ferric siderophore reductase|nr:siderophore-interacting protein [Bifidobacterium sp.]MCI1224894.1 siderophore-interacting protein [Bifidobacterium sp.]